MEGKTTPLVGVSQIHIANYYAANGAQVTPRLFRASVWEPLRDTVTPHALPSWTAGAWGVMSLTWASA